MINSSGMVLWITVHLSIYFYFAAGILWNVSLWDGFQGEPLAIGFVTAPSAGEKLVLSMYSNL